MIYIFTLEGKLLDEDSPENICKRYNLTMQSLERLLRDQTPFKDKYFQANEEFFDFSVSKEEREETSIIKGFGTLQDLEDFIRNGNNINQIELI